MTSFLERCNVVASSKPARIFYAVLLTIICVVGCIRLLNASNKMHEPHQKNAHLELVLKPHGGAFMDFNGTQENIRAWNSKLTEFLSPYRTPNPNRVKCDYNSPPPPGKSCEVDLDDFKQCSPSNNYGISSTHASVFLRLKYNPSWSPQFYNASYLPENMPADLKEYISYSKSQKAAWVSCDGDNPVDKENIGPIVYIPERGFHEHRMKKSNEDALEPLIAIHFQKPTIGIVITVKCQLWTRDTDESVSFFMKLE